MPLPGEGSGSTPRPLPNLIPSAGSGVPGPRLLPWWPSVYPPQGAQTDSLEGRPRVPPRGRRDQTPASCCVQHACVPAGPAGGPPTIGAAREAAGISAEPPPEPRAAPTVRAAHREWASVRRTFQAQPTLAGRGEARPAWPADDRGGGGGLGGPVRPP